MAKRHRKVSAVKAAHVKKARHHKRGGKKHSKTMVKA